MKKTLLSHLSLITYCIPTISTGFLTLAVFAALVTGSIRTGANPALAAPLFYAIIACVIGLLALLTILALYQYFMRLAEKNGSYYTVRWTDILCIVLSGALLVLFDRAIHGRFFFAKTFYLNGGSISVSIDYEGIVFIALALLIVLRQIIIFYKYSRHHKSADANTEP